MLLNRDVSSSAKNCAISHSIEENIVDFPSEIIFRQENRGNIKCFINQFNVLENLFDHI